MRKNTGLYVNILTNLRLSAGFTVSKLSKLSGVDRRKITRFEKTGNIDYKDHISLCLALGYHTQLIRTDAQPILLQNL